MKDSKEVPDEIREAEKMLEATEGLEELKRLIKVVEHIKDDNKEVDEVPEVKDRKIRKAEYMLDLDDIEDMRRGHVQLLNRGLYNGKVSKEVVSEVAKEKEGFLDLQEEALLELSKIAQEAGESQRGAIDAVASSLKGINKTLHTLSEKEITQDTALKIAEVSEKIGDKQVRISEIIKEMNKDNNDFWERMAAMGIGGAIIVVLIKG